MAMRQKDSDKICVVLERMKNEKMLPVLNPRVFAISKGTKVFDLMARIRRRLQLNSRQSFYLIVNPEGSRPAIPSQSEVVDDYVHHQEKDGFLYISYASQEVYG